MSGYDVRKDKFIENYITMDWKNKLYIYKNQDGKDIVLTGNKKLQAGIYSLLVVFAVMYHFIRYS